MDNIHFGTCEIVVETDNLMPQVKKPFTKVGPDKTGTTGH
jgi:hypothetical protein